MQRETDKVARRESIDRLSTTMVFLPYWERSDPTMVPTSGAKRPRVGIHCRGAAYQLSAGRDED